MLFFTSDTHFGHARINELAGRPFNSVEEMNETLIDNWNSVVRKGDTVIHLGDVALGPIAETLPLVGRCNGRKILVPGNHDRVFSGNKPDYIARFAPMYKAAFDEIYPEITEFDDYAIMCHFPYSGDSHADDRYTDKRPVDIGAPLIHGHVHEQWRINGRQFNVGVDVNDFTPVHVDVIHDWLDSL